MMTASEKMLKLMSAENKIKELRYELEKVMKLGECNTIWRAKFDFSTTEADNFFWQFDCVLTELSNWLNGLHCDELYEEAERLSQERKQKQQKEDILL